MIHIVRKSLPRFTRFLSLVLIKLVFTEIQPFENVKIYREMYGNPDAVRHGVFGRHWARNNPDLNFQLSGHGRTEPANSKELFTQYSSTLISVKTLIY